MLTSALEKFDSSAPDAESAEATEFAEICEKMLIWAKLSKKAIISENLRFKVISPKFIFIHYR